MPLTRRDGEEVYVNGDSVQIEVTHEIECSGKIVEDRKVKSSSSFITPMLANRIIEAGFQPEELGFEVVYP